MKRRFTFFAAALTAAAVVGALGAPTASAKTTCTGGVFTNVNISGGLIVSGPCVYNDSTISGGVTVTSTGCFELENSSMPTAGTSGGIVVQPGGELDIDHLCSSDTSTGEHSSISGGITFQAGGKDIDIFGATVSGGTTITGQAAPGFIPQICGSSLASVTVSNVIGNPFGSGFEMHVGDPNEPFSAGPVSDCPANTLSGSLTVKDSSNVEVEANTIGGSAYFTNVTGLEFAGNTVKGSAKCTNDTYATDLDPTPNNVHGGSNCP